MEIWVDGAFIRASWGEQNPASLSRPMDIRSEWGRFAWFEKNTSEGTNEAFIDSMLLVDEKHEIVRTSGMEHMISHLGKDHEDTKYIRNMEIAGRMMEGDAGNDIRRSFPEINEVILTQALARIVGAYVEKYLREDFKMEEYCAKIVMRESRTWYDLCKKVANELEPLT